MDDIAIMTEREAGMPESCPMVGVGFCLYPLEDAGATEKAGHPVFKDVEFVKIQVPGDRDSIVFQPASGEHKRRFPIAYQRFQQQKVVAQEGLPIEHWPMVTRAVAWTLKAAGIPTVEALAEVHDGNLEKLGTGMRDLRAKARAYLDNAKSSAAAQQLAREKQQLIDLVENLQGQIRQLAEQTGVDPAKLQLQQLKPARAKPLTKAQKAAAAKAAKKAA